MEIDFLFNTNQNGFLVYEGEAAATHRLENWISTPQGSLYGRPSWGHTLSQFLHDTPTETLSMVIESVLVEDLLRDLPDIQLRWVRVEPTEEMDAYLLKIGYTTKDLLAGTSEVLLGGAR